MVCHDYSPKKRAEQVHQESKSTDPILAQEARQEIYNALLLCELSLKGITPQSISRDLSIVQAGFQLPEKSQKDASILLEAIRTELEALRTSLHHRETHVRSDSAIEAIVEELSTYPERTRLLPSLDEPSAVAYSKEVKAQAEHSRDLLFGYYAAQNIDLIANINQALRVLKEDFESLIDECPFPTQDTQRTVTRLFEHFSSCLRTMARITAASELLPPTSSQTPDYENLVGIISKTLDVVTGSDYVATYVGHFAQPQEAERFRFLFQRFPRQAAALLTRFQVATDTDLPLEMDIAAKKELALARLDATLEQYGASENNRGFSARLLEACYLDLHGIESALKRREQLVPGSSVDDKILEEIREKYEHLSQPIQAADFVLKFDAKLDSEQFRTAYQFFLDAQSLGDEIVRELPLYKEDS